MGDVLHLRITWEVPTTGDVLVMTETRPGYVEWVINEQKHGLWRDEDGIVRYYIRGHAACHRPYDPDLDRKSLSPAEQAIAEA